MMLRQLIKAAPGARMATRALGVSSGGVEVTDTGIRDGSRGLLHVETRRMCKCEQCYGHLSHQYTLPDSKLHVRVTSVVKVTEHYLQVLWDDGHTGLVPRTDRGNFGPGSVTGLLDRYWEASVRSNKAMKYWLEENEEISRVHDWETVVGSAENTREFLLHFMTHGIGLLEHIPITMENLQQLIEQDLQIGPLMRTVFDPVDTVVLKPGAPTNVAYAPAPLHLHSDLQYYTQAPEVQLLCAESNDVVGGENFFVDAIAVAEEMREEEPGYFQTLTEVPIHITHHVPGTHSLGCKKPVILMSGEEIWGVTENPQGFDFYGTSRQLDLETRRRWWEAYTWYRTRIDDPARWFVNRLEAGQMVVLDGHRVLHARNGYRKTVPDQSRTFMTCYTSYSHVQNRMLLAEGVQGNLLELHLGE